MPVARDIFLVLITVAIAVAALACSSSDTEEPPTAQEKDAYCSDVARVSDGLQDVRDAMVPIDEVKMQDARADLRASLDYLDSSSRELEGGDDLVLQLKEDMSEFLELMATPNLASVTTNLQAQADTIQDDVNDLEAAGNCP